MGVHLPRAKQPAPLIAGIYRLSRLLAFIPARHRLRLWLDLQWIFERLAHELSFVVVPPETHPVRLGSMNFLSRYLEPTDRVLDVGCKQGDLARLIAPRVAETIGIDLDASALPAAEASNSPSSLRFLHGDAVEYCEKNPGRFDVVVLCHVIEHLDDPGRLLRAAARCRRGVFIEVPDFECTLSNQYRVLTQSPLVYSDPDHVWEFGRQELRQLATTCGLTAVHEETQGGVIRAWFVPSKQP